jgi:hypothetical protein
LQNKENDHNKKQREMDFIKAVNIIGRDLEEARTLLDQLSSMPGSHLAEIELAKARINTAAELLKLLPGLAGAPTRETKTEMTLKDVVQEIEGITKAETKSEPEMVIRGKYEEPAATPASAPTPTSEPEHATAPSQPQAKPKEAVKAILADRFGATGTIGEKISSPKKDEAITSAMQNRPIADIAAAIGINDKFYYIRELFSGDATAYNDTVRRLNSASSLGEAMKILDESTVMGSDPAAQSSFVDVVRRKFNLNV